MGFHNNNQLFHRRVAALKQRRLSPEEEAAKLKELIARFSPTFNWTATLTDSIPLPTLPPALATTTATSDDDSGNTPVTTSSTPAPVPVTTPTIPTTTSTSTPVANTNTVVAPNPVVQTTNAVPTTSTSTVVVAAPATTSSPPAAGVTTPGKTLPITTASGPATSVIVSTSSRTLSSAAASATQTESSGSGTNVGGIVGGLAGGLIGVAVLIFNRQRRRNDELSAAAFNAHDFRRSAVLMEDPPTRDEIVEHGFNPRPPTMIERRLASPAPTFGGQYGGQGPVMGPSDYGYNQYQAYGPMQTMSPSSATVMLNNSPYPNPAYPNPAYTQSPFSPIATPTSATYNEQAAVLTRQSSNGSHTSAVNGPAGYPSEDPNYGGYPSPKQGEYVDLNRSSVTPYQAAQYAEISQTLNTEAHSGPDTPAINLVNPNSKTHEIAPPLLVKDNGPSPFTDPTDHLPGQLTYPGEVSPRPSTDSVSRQIDDFPVPPSPVHSSISRLDSVPPLLPEIPIGSRPSSYNFPASDRGNAIPNGVTKEYSKSPLGSQVPSAPSPLASGIAITAPPPAVTSFPDAPPTPRQGKFETVVKRPDTVYDDNDAYGGI
ncbi:hypothetical protein C0995_001141 [Termitomyces sp. Mi166|nr:hypothetical protein C0995_001141 [Termitomyces sp. Mi166\